MRPIGLSPVKFGSKKDCHPKKMQANSKRLDLDKFNDKDVKPYYRKNQYQNWWEDVGSKGIGKIKQELNQEIENELFEMTDD